MEEHVSRALAHFGAKFFKEADSQEAETRRSYSTVCSPLSAEIVMAMLALSCKEKSNHELLKVLDFPDDDALRWSFSHLMSTLHPIKGATTFNVANKMFVQTGEELKPAVKKDAEDVFHSSVEHVDFNRRKADELDASHIIDVWLKQQTSGNPFLRWPLDKTTRLVLVNAIYFQGVWEKPFDTRQDVTNFPFRLSKDVTTSVTLMKMTETRFNYGVSPELKARLLQMRFEGGEANMVIVLPDEVEGLESVLEKLASGHNIMADIESLRKTELDVMFPKFEARRSLTSIPSVALLIKLGIKSIFDERKSEVNILTSNEELLGSYAEHDIINQVDEREIAETTECDMSKAEGISSDHRDACFVTDRPFLYFIIVHGIPIFMGSYRGNDRPDKALNYSCNHLNHLFSLSACTLYARYDNRLEEERLRRILESHTQRVLTEACLENRANRLRERQSMPILDIFAILDSNYDMLP